MELMFLSSLLLPPLPIVSEGHNVVIMGGKLTAYDTKLQNFSVKHFIFDECIATKLLLFLSCSAFVSTLAGYRSWSTRGTKPAGRDPGGRSKIGK